jgi:Asp-tRNA(Asn)/Glu-tRNA(Gln) amidotransferase B subunit
VRPADLAQLLAFVRDGTLTRPRAQQVFARMLDTGRPPAQVMAEHGLIPVREPAAG